MNVTDISPAYSRWVERHPKNPANWPVHRGRVVTPTGIVIGLAHIPKPQPVHSLDAQRIQAALLEPRTVIPQSLLRRVVGRIINWF